MSDSVKTLGYTVLSTFFLFLLVYMDVACGFFLGWFLILNEIVVLFLKKKSQNKLNPP